jgi:hypothetical protein
MQGLGRGRGPGADSRRLIHVVSSFRRSGVLHPTQRRRSPYVQRKKALELQQAWGGKPCAHPAFSREYDLGERTGSYCCTTCGAVVSFREKTEIMAARGTQSARPT